ncbi:MAG: SDR family oxidoreductase [Sphingobium sp.]
MNSLNGKIAIITGGGAGIGHAIASLFAEQGAMVAAVVRSESSMRKWDGATGVVAVQADITQAEEIERLFADVERDLGKPDIVCNVAGINDLSFPVTETSDERWDAVMDLDLKAPFRICRRAIPGMVEKGSGAILNVGSYAALRGNHGPSYTAAKSGLIGLTRSIAVYYAKSGVRCNIINPGAVRTEIGTHSGGEYHPEGYKMFRGIVNELPVNWICDTNQIAPTALFLCSEEARHINGAVISVDGGMSAC